MHTPNIIIKNGLLLVEIYNENIQKRATEELVYKDFLKYLSYTTTFSGDLTVEGFMNAFKPYFDVIDKHFISFTGGFKLAHFYEQMQKPAEHLKVPDDVSHIEFSWLSELQIYNNLSTGKKETTFDLYGCYHGIPFSKHEASISFSLSPINEWKHYLLKMNNEFSCDCFDDDEPDDTKKFKNIFKASKEFTLHDVIRYFFFELTWHGYTSDINSLVESLNKISSEIDTSEAKTVDFLDVRIELLNEELKQAHDEENYEGAERIVNKIKELQSQKEVKK